MNRIANQTYEEERALYNINDTSIESCTFKGELDGESVLKECSDINVMSCSFYLRYPLWHASRYRVDNTSFLEPSRAPLWYCSYGDISRTKIYSVKALRECINTSITDSYIKSEEFGWKCTSIRMNNSSLEGFYAFFESKDIDINNIDFKGKYSFQYTEDVTIKNSRLDTKDAFWHSKRVTVINSIIKGEYLGWFSEGLTIINCKIIGTQPLCYCKNLKIIDSEMIDCDLSFEYSEVDASIKGHIDSIKNPKSGRIVVDSVGEIIKDHSIMDIEAAIIVKH